MWLRSVFLKTLRDCRVPIAGWGLGIGGMAPLIFALVPTLLADSNARAALAALAHHPAVRLFAEPVDVLTPGGYATWRLTLILPLVSVWALLVTTRTVRGEEESGALDLLLSTPRSRLHVVTAKLAAIATALVLIGSVMGLMAFAGARFTDTAVSLGAALLFGFNTALLAAVFAACALLASQFTRGRRSAAGFTGALLGLSMMMASAGRVLPGASWVGRLSPLYYFERSKPLVTGADPQAMLVLAALTAALSAAGVVLFLRRDVGGQIALAPGAREHAAVRGPALPPPAPLLQSIFGRSLAALRVPIVSWGLALAVYAAGLTAILQQAQRNLADLLETAARARGPMFAALVSRLTGGHDSAMNERALNAIFTLVAVVIAAFAVTLTSRWAADEDEGRLDLLLSTPHRRSHIMLARFSALTIALLAVTGCLFASTGLTAWIGSFALNRVRLAEAAFGMVPIGMVVAAAGYLLAGWLRSSSVTGVLTGLLLASFVVTLLGPLFKWPPAVMQLSIFEQYGAPLVDGLHPARVAGLLVVAGATLTAATVRFATKDLVR